MAFPTMQTWVTGQIVEASDLNSDVRDAARYLKGQDGSVTIEDSVIIQTAAGKYLQVPSMTTVNLPASPAAGMIVYDSTLSVFKRYENGAWVSFTDLAAMTIASIAQGDIFFRGASAIERLAAGTSGYILKTQGAGANPVWGAGIGANTGTYSGDDSANRAIAHGLSATPKLVIITRDATAASELGIIITAAFVHYWDTAGGGSAGLAVTAPDGTNFYVGNATSYPRSMNGSGRNYQWAAMT